MYDYYEYASVYLFVCVYVYTGVLFLMRLDRFFSTRFSHMHDKLVSESSVLKRQRQRQQQQQQQQQQW